MAPPFGFPLAPAIPAYVSSQNHPFSSSQPRHEDLHPYTQSNFTPAAVSHPEIPAARPAGPAPFPLNHTASAPASQPPIVVVLSDTESDDDGYEEPAPPNSSDIILYNSEWVKAHYRTTLTTSSGRMLPPKPTLHIEGENELEAAQQLIKTIEGTFKDGRRSDVDILTASSWNVVT